MSELSAAGRAGSINLGPSCNYMYGVVQMKGPRHPLLTPEPRPTNVGALRMWPRSAGFKQVVVSITSREKYHFVINWKECNNYWGSLWSISLLIDRVLFVFITLFSCENVSFFLSRKERNPSLRNNVFSRYNLTNLSIPLTVWKITISWSTSF